MMLAESSVLELFLNNFVVFVLAMFVGFEVISKVPPLLHTPLTSGANAISGITIVGSLVIAGSDPTLSKVLGFIAIVCAMTNVVGGYLVTHRMLNMFKKKRSAGP